ncbi:glucose 1-dehydrogenase [Streptomyces olivaceiscleroticus]|uniref:SDR family NAD(P)-dependent oxidoreductase n=1 Tax=Streptomyces olivaceiscleroticus TaxID=68245 RepID=A0ABN0ZYW1_9ACTN
MTETIALHGKKALVTGASRGIGRAIALDYARAGADVALLARTEELLDVLASEIRALGRIALAVPCDVTHPEQITEAVDTVLEEFDVVDVVTNNAGGNGRPRHFLDLPRAAWDEAMRLNLYSAADLCRAMGPHLTARGQGAVLNVASFAGQGGVPLLSPYAAAKAGLISLTQSLAAEWAHTGVRVNALVPGWVATDLTTPLSTDAQLSAGLLQSVPAGRWAAPEDLTGAAVYLASDAARMVTGACLTVDGGMSALRGGTTMLQLSRAAGAAAAEDTGHAARP